MLDASPESYRTWDAGRRATPPKILARARALATHRDEHALLPLPVLALLIGVHVKTLRAAARDGRLPVTYDNKTTFRQLRARATLAAVTQFRHAYYGRQVRPADRRVPLTWASVPDDYAEQIRAFRRARGLSQAQGWAVVSIAPAIEQHYPGLNDAQRAIVEALTSPKACWVILDGGKGLRAAVRKAFRHRALVHRCQWHKRENVVSYLAKREQAVWRQRLQRAYHCPEYEEARAALETLHSELEDRNQSAAGSLKEGLDETLTLHRLGLYGVLGR